MIKLVYYKVFNFMDGYITNILQATLDNNTFRTVLHTGPHAQLVVMCLKPLEDIGEEVHPNVDQFIRIEKGEGKAVLNGVETIIKDDSIVYINAGTRHNIINTSSTNDLKLYTLYSPANHPKGTVHVTKADAVAAEEQEHSVSQ